MALIGQTDINTGHAGRMHTKVRKRKTEVGCHRPAVRPEPVDSAMPYRSALFYNVSESSRAKRQRCWSYCMGLMSAGVVPYLLLKFLLRAFELVRR